MKVIDLLNKIANGEKVPKKIKIVNTEYIFNDDEKEYQRYNEKLDLHYGLGEDRRLDLCLNDEIEILEEQKKIPEKIEYYDDSIAWVIDDVGQISDVDKVIIDKYNEIIDYLKSKGE